MKYQKKQSAILLLEDGTIFHGKSAGSIGTATGELCFNTGMTGYQEVMTDPSYFGQLLTFTYPEIGNTGINFEDSESNNSVKGLIVRNFSNNNSLGFIRKNLSRTNFLLGAIPNPG